MMVRGCCIKCVVSANGDVVVCFFDIQRLQELLLLS